MELLAALQNAGLLRQKLTDGHCFRVFWQTHLASEKKPTTHPPQPHGHSQVHFYFICIYMLYEHSLAYF